MVQKRPFDAEEISEVSSKHPKQAEPSNKHSSFSEPVSPDYACQIPKPLDSGCGQSRTEGDSKVASDNFVELPRVPGDTETSFPGSISASSWATSSTSEDVRSEPPFHFSLFPDYFGPELPIRILTRYEDIYSILLEHPPRKPVPVGPDHQANIPTWDSRGVNSRSDAVSDSNFVFGDEIDKSLMGTCVIPMSDGGLSDCDDEKVGKGRTDCDCEDRCSVRCVRQHVVEKGEEIFKSLGQERFINLGLCDMGEQVAEKWSAEEEQLFHEFVFSNPASMGKNFWNNLPTVFPSRSKKELVSYYFNVFMLRKRAEQNRNDLLNIDSDNDEWQGSDDFGDVEIGTGEDDEDSVPVSPVFQGDTSPNCHENDTQDYYEYTAEETGDVIGTVDFTKRDIDDDSNCGHAKEHQYGSPTSPIQPQDKEVWHERRDEEVQDDSCTSSDTGVALQESNGKSENGDHWAGNSNGVSNGCSQGYVLEPCEAKVWDSGFLSCSKNKMDFIPTCNMIEEVFGDGRRQDMRRV
ncbi:hypothetical protein L6164_014521 [Bauhinia variegata]|uniref:Uncharacterized protein n=1 Tax=Bauhinia variegata TaxID=167791 RepID=A0ACB9NIG4_BAUVA|nr:hypothetical protein L6164_014521 [Bauhinia variegata]